MVMNYKKFSKLDFKKFHPGGSLSVKLKTVSDLMLTGNKIPFVQEHLDMKAALKILTNKKNIKCINAGEGNKQAVAEHALGMILSLVNNLSLIHI